MVFLTDGPYDGPSLVGTTDFLGFILEAAVIVKLALLNYKLLFIPFIIKAPNTHSSTSSAWRRRQRRNTRSKRILETAVRLALIGSGTALTILELSANSLDKNLRLVTTRLFLICSAAYVESMVEAQCNCSFNLSCTTERCFGRPSGILQDGKIGYDVDEREYVERKVDTASGADPGPRASSSYLGCNRTLLPPSNGSLCVGHQWSASDRRSARPLAISLKKTALTRGIFPSTSFCRSLGPIGSDSTLTKIALSGLPSPAFGPGSPARQGALNV